MAFNSFFFLDYILHYNDPWCGLSMLTESLCHQGLQATMACNMQQPENQGLNGHLQKEITKPQI